MLIYRVSQVPELELILHIVVWAADPRVRSALDGNSGLE
jgi:hypothetical protein